MDARLPGLSFVRFTVLKSVAPDKSRLIEVDGSFRFVIFLSVFTIIWSPAVSAVSRNPSL